MRFRPIQAQVNRVYQLIRSPKPVDALDWAESSARLDVLTEQLGDIYWRVKLDLLLKDL